MEKKRILEYRVVRSDSIEGLEAECMKLVVADDRWEFRGGMSIHLAPFTGNVFSQSMVLVRPQRIRAPKVNEVNTTWTARGGLKVQNKSLKVYKEVSKILGREVGRYDTKLKKSVNLK